MNRDGVKKVQELLYVWISNFDKRSLESIKQNCDYLNDVYHLGLQNPIWSIFWPLVFNGVIDHVGNGFYALSIPIILDYGSHCYFININSKEVRKTPVAVGIQLSDNCEDLQYKTMHPSPLSILKTFPSIREVVDSFPKTLEDESNLKYVNWKSKRGLAELDKDGLTRYFSLPDIMYIRQLPSRTINPEAYALAYCLTRVESNESNGKYNSSNQRLSMPAFAMPFMIYRVLLLETMSTKQMPRKVDNEYIFDNISPKIVKQLNRIFCDSIHYE